MGRRSVSTSSGAFVELWTETSEYFRRQPGFLSLRLHRAVTPGAPYRYVNVARWASAYRAPHGTDEFRALVTREAWREFPSSPVLYEVVLGVGDDAGSASRRPSASGAAISARSSRPGRRRCGRRPRRVRPWSRWLAAAAVVAPGGGLAMRLAEAEGERVPIRSADAIGSS